MTQRRLAFTPPLFVQPEPSSAGMNPLQFVILYRKPVLRSQKRLEGTQHKVEIGVFFKLENLKCILPTVYNHMAAVIKCYD